jgi:acyl-CoA thioesterase-1
MLQRVLRVGGPLLIAISATACEAAAGPTAPTSMDPAQAQGPKHIVVLGDSLAISPSRDAGFPSVLQEKLDREEIAYRITNAGVRGDTTAGGLRRLNDVLSPAPDILILALGANDGLRGLEISAIQRNLNEIITRAKARGAKVLLCGMETPPLRGWSYTLAFHNIFPALAREHDIPLVPFLLAGVALDPEMNGGDMIHPNAAGARRIADTVWPFLEPFVRAATAARR